jgi:4a-hydroxytetrahydrobiopterin dehydratase
MAENIPSLKSQPEIADFISCYSNWKLKDNALRAEYQFSTFQEAFIVMTRGAFISEQLGHHPDWSNVYSKLSISLSTHDAGGITEKDLDWIRAFEEGLNRTLA